MHGASVKFQYHDPRLRGFLVHDEGRIGDDAVHAFLLHTRKAAERLVGDVLAEARQTDFGTVQLHDAPHAAADVLDLKHGHFVRQNLVAGMVFALNADAGSTVKRNPSFATASMAACVITPASSVTLMFS